VDSGRSLKIEQDVYMLGWHEWRHFLPKIDAFLLLRTADDVKDEAIELVNRVNIRAKRYELKVSQGDDKKLFTEYQERLQRTHLEFFEEPLAKPPHHGTPNGIPCIHIKTQDIPYHEDHNEAAKDLLVTKIASFLAPIILNAKKTHHQRQWC
jgi:flagellar assembly factor FliW